MKWVLWALSTSDCLGFLCRLRNYSEQSVGSVVGTAKWIGLEDEVGGCGNFSGEVVLGIVAGSIWMGQLAGLAVAEGWNKSRCWT